MKLTKVKFEYSPCEEKKSGIPAIIVAAGESLRMGGINKQLAKIGGIPVIVKTLLAFESSPYISDIILVVRTDDLFEIQMMTEKYMIYKLTDIVCGGKTRQESVEKGLSRLDKSVSRVLIHDGARPFADNKIIAAVASALEDHVAVTCAVRPKDTIKQVDENGKVIQTPDRDTLAAVQTPQGVRLPEYLNAIEKAGSGCFTDDMSVMEAAGYEAYTVPGSYRNIKITTPEDIIIAEALNMEEQE